MFLSSWIFNIIIIIRLLVLEAWWTEENSELAVMSSQARKPKMKWTEQMNKDVLECKRRAKELVSSENPPCNENGRKRGYIDVMKDLWDDMGYKNLQLKSQNLRDQASRLEKMNNSGINVGTAGGSIEDPGSTTIVSEYSTQEYNENENQSNRNVGSENANFPAIVPNVHMAETEQIPEESGATMGDSSRRCLMTFQAVCRSIRTSTRQT